MADPAADVADLRRMGEVVLEATDRANRLLTSLLLLARTQARGVSVAAARRPGRPDRTGAARGRCRTARTAADGDRGRRTRGGPRGSGPAGTAGRQPGGERRPAQRAGGWIRIRTETVGAAGVLEVASSGPVIDSRTLAELFEPFRQGQRARTGHRGTGLGLSIVRAVVAAHGGHRRRRAGPRRRAAGHRAARAGWSAELPGRRMATRVWRTGMSRSGHGHWRRRSARVDSGGVRHAVEPGCRRGDPGRVGDGGVPPLGRATGAARRDAAHRGRRRAVRVGRAGRDGRADRGRRHAAPGWRRWPRCSRPTSAAADRSCTGSGWRSTGRTSGWRCVTRCRRPRTSPRSPPPSTGWTVVAGPARGPEKSWR